jgi:hypothetical protein
MVAADVISFGSYRLIPAERLLLKDQEVVTGRGYCFVAQIQRSAISPTTLVPMQPPSVGLPTSRDKLPARLARMIGRDGTVATVLGVLVQAQDPLPSLLAFMATRRVLLVLDSCEHVIDAAASLTARLYRDAPEVHLLTTSRESLRVEGEHVHLLPPLDYPAARDDLTATEALTSPAVQLFMERACASGYSGSLTDAEAPVVASICRQLDGIALAIELQPFQAPLAGASQRHQTLHAMLDWSYNLLSARDRRVLDRLSIFVGVFTMEAATEPTTIGCLTRPEPSRAKSSRKPTKRRPSPDFTRSTTQSVRAAFRTRGSIQECVS